MTTEPTDSYFNRLVDTDALRTYLESHLDPPTTFRVERHQAGHSNETLFITWDDARYVLRRPPPGETADRAHDVLREYRVIDALQDTNVRVPPTVIACEDESVIGAEFYVMEHVAGDVIRTDEPPRFSTPDHRERIGHELVDRLAEINTIDPATVGLGAFGRPAGYTERQVEIWHRQFDWAFEITSTEREIPALTEIGTWLDDHRPESHPHALVHGDYKLDNVLFAPGTPPVIASIFDWELATLGDPRADLGYTLVFWRDPADPDPAVPELVPSFTANPGYPTRRDLVDRWEARTGFTFEHERFYRTLGAYKLAAFCEMFYRRYLEGNADDPLYPKMHTRVPDLADHATRIINGDEPL